MLCPLAFAEENSNCSGGAKYLMRFLYYIILLITIVIALTFASLNAEPVTLNYYIGTRTISLSLLLVLCLGVGIILGFLIALVPLLRLKHSNYLLKKQLNRKLK
jgi:uncharacterized membrane protein YciS (DUF1049 family)